MKFLHRTTNYTLLDHKRNEDFLEQFRIQPVQEKLSACGNNWLLTCCSQEFQEKLLIIIQETKGYVRDILKWAKSWAK